MSQAITLQTFKKSPVGRLIKKIARPVLRGWVDAGRFIVQAPHLRVMLQRVRQESPRIQSILNAGAGEGLYSPLLIEFSDAKEIVELDASFATAERLTDPRQRLITASLTALPLPAETFDLILCSEVLEHIEEDKQALSELVRALSRGGWLLISVPKPPAVFDPAHVREGYALDDLREMVEANSLEVVDVRYCMHSAFRFLLNRCRDGYVPRFLVCVISWLDRLAPISEPMDLIMLTRKTG